MRESSNLNLDLHHQHQDFHGPSSSSLAAPPPFHFVATSNRNHDWNQHLLLNNGDDQLMAPREFMRPSRDDDVAMVQDLGMFQWPAAADQQGGYSIPWAEVGDLGFDHHQPMANLGGGFGRPGTGFGTVLPTTNISAAAAAAAGGTSHQLPALLPPLPYSNPLGVDHVVGRALDLFSSSGRLGRTSLCQLPAAVAVDHNMAYGLGQLQELPAAAQVQASLSRKQVSPSSFGAAHSNGDLEYKATQSVAKKPRLESPRASFTPFKVRKEKLGDRIAALQQLVSPFGKTDTASVLKEARDYIKFLQDQVETLSVPYMRSSNNKKMRTSEETSTEEREEPKLDLRSRGLCLVPLSCTSYVTDENGGVWSPPNYRGGAT